MTAHALDVPAYLGRIGLIAPPAADAAGLRALQVAHLTHVPFENLDIGAGRTLSLDLADLEAKVVGAHRGGFCYELNGLFAALLETLGFRVSRLAAETWASEGEGWGPPFDHLVLRVDLDDPWLVDVGFGDSFREPMPLRDGASSPSPSGAVFGLAREDDRWSLSEWSPGMDRPAPQYRFDGVPHRLADFEPMCRYQQTASPWFTGHRIVTVATPDGRRTLFDDRLVVRVGLERTERRVAEPEVPGLLRDLFGIVMTRPVVD